VTTPEAPKPARTRLTAALDVLAVGACAALFAGLVLVAIAAFRRIVLHQLTFASLDAAWMAPLGTLAVFLVPATLIAAATALVPRLVPPRLVFVLFSFLAVLSVLLPFKQFHPAASITLALGAAWRLSAGLASRNGRAMRWARRGVLGMGGVVAALAAVVLVALPTASARALARLPAAPSGAPNILLLVLDTVRGEELGLYGYSQPTSPRIDEFAARGAVFDRAIAPSAWTLASHASMFTGRRPGELSARWWTPLDRSNQTLAEVLRDYGYRTAGFAANFYYTGVESGVARGFLHYEDLVRTWRQVLWSTSLAQMPLLRDLARSRSRDSVWAALSRHEIRVAGRTTSRDHKTAERVTSDLLRWLDRQERGPFFAFINYFDAHDRREPLEAGFDHFGSGDRARYDGFLARTDHAIGNLLDELARRGVLDNTIVVITSDHGDLFGEHGIWGHGNGLHMPALWVPLIVVYPRGIPAGVRVADPVSLQDIAATLVDLAGVASTAVLPGTSLTAYWRAGGGAQPARTVFSEVEKFKDPRSPGPAQLGPMRSLIDANWHYILNGDGSEELFAWPRDPAELENLAARGRQPPPDFARLSALARAVPSSYR
jgi:arylsulfatase A-like enzyme